VFEGAAGSVRYIARHPVCAPASIDSFGKRESTIGLVSLRGEGYDPLSLENFPFLCNAIFRLLDSASKRGARMERSGIRSDTLRRSM